MIVLSKQTTGINIMNEFEREQKQIEISDLADKYMDEAMANGDAFSEGLCNWAISKAEQEIGNVPQSY